MINRPKISVIVPVYNAGAALSNCINSILSQTYRDFELLLINDGSTDNSGVICNEFSSSDSRIIVSHEQNNGVSIARNIGIEKAIGEWIVFIDADDYIEDKFLVSLITPSKLSRNTIVITGVKRVEFDNNKILWQREFPNQILEIGNKNEFSNEIISNEVLMYGTICGKLYNREIINQYFLRFDERLSLHEDHLFYFQYLSFVNTIVLVDGLMYCYVSDTKKITLSTNKVHSFDELYLANVLLKKNFNRLMLVWDITPDMRFSSILNFIYSMYTRALQSGYKLNLTKDKRLKALSYCNKSELKMSYNPPSIQGKIFKFVLRIFPIFIADRIFSILIKKQL